MISLEKAVVTKISTYHERDDNVSSMVKDRMKAAKIVVDLYCKAAISSNGW